MSDTLFEIKGDEIMEKIRENIRRRKAAGVYPPDPDSLVTSQAEFIGKSSSFNVTGFKRGYSDCRSLSSIIFAM